MLLAVQVWKFSLIACLIHPTDIGASRPSGAMNVLLEYLELQLTANGKPVSESLS